MPHQRALVPKVPWNEVHVPCQFTSPSEVCGGSGFRNCDVMDSIAPLRRLMGDFHLRLPFVDSMCTAMEAFYRGDAAGCVQGLQRAGENAAQGSTEADLFQLATVVTGKRWEETQGGAMRIYKDLEYRYYRDSASTEDKTNFILIACVLTLYNLRVHGQRPTH